MSAAEGYWQWCVLTHVLPVPCSYESVGWLWSPSSAATLIKVSVGSDSCLQCTQAPCSDLTSPEAKVDCCERLNSALQSSALHLLHFKSRLTDITRLQDGRGDFLIVQVCRFPMQHSTSHEHAVYSVCAKRSHSHRHQASDLICMLLFTAMRHVEVLVSKHFHQKGNSEIAIKKQVCRNTTTC